MSKVRTYKEKVQGGQKLVQLWIDSDKWELIKRAADSVQEPMTTWIRRAVFTSLRRWETPDKDSKLWSKCSICGKHHNRDEHFAEE